MNNKEWKKWLFWFSFAVATIAVYKTIDSVSEIFLGIGNFFNLIMPFIIALLIAYILYIPCKKIENFFKKLKVTFFQKHARGLSVLLVYLITFGLIYIAITFILPAVTTSIKDLAENIPNYYNSAKDYIDNVEEDSLLSKLHVNKYIKSLEEVELEKEILKWINLENVGSYIKGIVGATNIIFDIFVTVVVSIYMLLERNEIGKFLGRLLGVIFDRKTNRTISKYYKKTSDIFFTFITSQVIDAFLVGFIVSIVMNIMNIKYATLLGFMIGLFNVIPYFGAIVAVGISVIITIFTGGFGQAISLAIIVIIIQQVDANIINPRILGTSLDLSPILVIFAVTVGGAYFGVLGMFLGVPVIAFAKLLIKDFIEYKNLKNIEQ